MSKEILITLFILDTESIIMMLFPLVFIVHELEELCGIPFWNTHIYPLMKRKDKSKTTTCIINRIHGIKITHLKFIIIEEVLIVVFITLYSVYYQNYEMFFGLIIAYSLHLVGHIISTILVRSYLPMTLTSLLSLPYIIIVLIQLEPHIIFWNTVIFYSVVFMIFTIINIVMLEKLLKKLTYKNTN